MTTANRLYRIVTLGCKVNQYESQLVREALLQHGWHEAVGNERASLCLVNTCTVTSEGDAKSRQMIRRLYRRNPGADIVVTGCYATNAPEAVAKLPGVRKVVTDKNRLGEALADWAIESLPSSISFFEGHSRAFVKVQDGCLLNCSYCIIPKVRPAMRSRPLAEIRDEVARLVENGYREVVLTGVHLGHYGIDLSRGKSKAHWTRLWHLIDALDRLPGEFRIRLSSLEAAEARDDLISAMANSSRVVPHLHLCLQSGSNRVLKAMRRRYTSGGFLARVERIRQQLDSVALTTDVIVGFPGETEADFAATCHVARQAEFAKMHIFPFSPRQGTPAATFRDVVGPRIIDERKHRLAELETELAARYRQSLLGRRLQVLFERCVEGGVVGTSCRYVPVVVPSASSAIVGRLMEVDIVGEADDRLIGRLPAALDNGGNRYQPQCTMRADRISLPLL